jgi:hypothetical protein
LISSPIDPLAEGARASLYPNRQGMKGASAMAAENDHDLQPHLDTWHGFVKVLFYGAGGALLILALLATFFL